MKKYWLSLFLVISFLVQAEAQARESDLKLRQSSDWESFDRGMQEAEIRDRRDGWAYIASGALVTLGGFYASEKTQDPGTKFIFGISQGLGIAGIGYGIAKLSFGNEYHSFYETLRNTALTPAQRDALVRRYLELEREKREILRKTQLYTHLVIGAMNLYSANQEKDATAKGFFQLLAGVNFALAISYTF